MEIIFIYNVSKYGFSINQQTNPLLPVQCVDVHMKKITYKIYNSNKNNITKINKISHLKSNINVRTVLFNKSLKMYINVFYVLLINYVKFVIYQINILNILLSDKYKIIKINGVVPNNEENNR